MTTATQAAAEKPIVVITKDPLILTYLYMRGLVPADAEWSGCVCPSCINGRHVISTASMPNYVISKLASFRRLTITGGQVNTHGPVGLDWLEKHGVSISDPIPVEPVDASAAAGGGSARSPGS